MRATWALPWVIFFGMLASTVFGDDARELVQLPELMRENLLANMRDHIAASNRIMRHVADGEFDDAAKLAEQRLA